MRPPTPHLPRKPRTQPCSRYLLLGTGTVLLAALGVLAGAARIALAQPADPVLQGVLDRLRLVIIGLLVTLASLVLAVGGIFYLLGGLTGDPAKIEKAKTAVRSAAIGYGLAALAVPLTELLKYVVGR